MLRFCLQRKKINVVAISTWRLGFVHSYVRNMEYCRSEPNGIGSVCGLVASYGEGIVKC
jgi:hypothetical protein